MRKVCFFAVIVILFATSNIASNPSTVNEKPAIIPSEDYVAHDPIMITSDSDFETQGWPGDGSVGDPYVIDGLSIDAAKGGHCIEIRNTRARFTVRNTQLNHTGSEWIGGHYSSIGIKLFNSTHGKIENCKFIENGVGIYIIMSNNTLIKGNNICSGVADDSIISAISSHVTISNNICNSSSFSIYLGSDGYDISRALDIFESYSGSWNNLTVANNTCTSYGRGILIMGCMSGIIKNNTASSNDRYWDSDEEGAMTHGSNFAIYDSRNLLITNNTGIAKGVSISISGGRNISVVKNSFTSLEFHPAYDESKLAFFDYNYYSDYDGIDANGDGIGDTQYFDLYGNIQDEHPLMYYPWYEPTTNIGISFLLFVAGGLSIAAIVIVILWFKRH